MATTLVWKITKLRGIDQYWSAIQAADFNLYDENGDKISWPEGTTAESSLETWSAETADKLIDSDSNTKWGSPNWGADAYGLAIVTFNIPEDIRPASYSYTTAKGDATYEINRDPVSWCLYYKDNDKTTKLISEVENATITTVRFAETQKWECDYTNGNWYQITGDTLTSLADEARRIDNSTELLTPAQMLEIFKNANKGGGGSLEGLENGYDVMFYDENNYGLAFYSIKQGHTINPPVYDCKAWQTEDGANVEFPLTPTEDVIFYANNDTLASQLYEFYGVDAGVYPCVLIQYNRDSWLLNIVFGEFINTNNIPCVMGMIGSGCYKSISDRSPENMVKVVMESGMTVKESTSSYIGMDNDTNRFVYYANFEHSFTNAEFYRLDE